MCDNIHDKITTGYYDDCGPRPQKPENKCGGCGKPFSLTSNKPETAPNFCQECGQPIKESFLAKHEQYKAECRAQNERRHAKELEFSKDAIAYVGLTGHPKADKALNKAKQSGSYRGDWVSELEELAELIMD